MTQNKQCDTIHNGKKKIHTHQKTIKKEKKILGFGEAIQSVFSKYATFSGRARRSEYWYFVLLQVIVTAVLNGLYSATESVAFSAILVLFDLALLVPCLAVCWRRLHDIGKSGGYYFFVLIPLVGWILLLVWMCQDSQPGANQYGPNPKGM